MSGHSTVGWVDLVVILLYLLATGYLGWIAYRGTNSASDFLLGGRTAHPFIMAVSYGATFISTAAIVGFGGVAGLFGMSLLWLTFLNIAVGIFLAFVVLGEPTRRIGHHLGAHTFPELLGLRYQSKGIQLFAGGLIFLFMPLYAAAVLTGGSVFAAAQFGIDFEVALLLFSLITVAYVIPGGLKAVMYTDTLQGVIMLLGMVVLVIFTYWSLGGVTDAHRFLTGMTNLVPAELKAIGHQGWTAMPAFGWGAKGYDMWWTVVTAIILGVGIGVLAQPQLVVRFMTVRSRRELDRAVPIGGVFILVMVAVPYVVGSLSNAWFVQYGPLLTGRVVETLDAAQGRARVELMRQNSHGRWEPIVNEKTGKPTVAPMAIAEKRPETDAGGARFELVSGRSPSIVNAKGQADEIIPTYITAAMPRWFGLLFFMTLLSAAMSTLSVRTPDGKGGGKPAQRRGGPHGDRHRPDRGGDDQLQRPAGVRHRPLHGDLLRPVRRDLPSRLRRRFILEADHPCGRAGVDGRGRRGLAVLAAAGQGPRGERDRSGSVGNRGQDEPPGRLPELAVRRPGDRRAAPLDPDARDGQRLHAAAGGRAPGALLP